MVGRSRSVLLGGLSIAVALFSVTSSDAIAQALDRSDDERAIRRAAQSYIAALDRGDAEELARYWIEDGDFVDETGMSHPASELIADAAQAVDAKSRPHVKLVESRIRFLNDDAAIEDGTSEVTPPGGGSATRGRFSAIWVRSAGRWKLASLREAPIGRVNEPVRLADLEWMIGDWKATSGETTLESTARWNATKTFLLRDLKVSRGGEIVYLVAQRIGWDPLSRKLKSWIFDSDGGYGEGNWTRQGDDWAIQSTGVLPDGRQVLASGTLVREGSDSFTWKSSRSGIDGEPGRNVSVTFVRVRGQD